MVKGIFPKGNLSDKFDIFKKEQKKMKGRFVSSEECLEVLLDFFMANQEDENAD